MLFIVSEPQTNTNYGQYSYNNYNRIGYVSEKASNVSSHKVALQIVDLYETIQKHLSQLKIKRISIFGFFFFELVSLNLIFGV